MVNLGKIYSHKVSLYQTLNVKPYQSPKLVLGTMHSLNIHVYNSDADKKNPCIQMALHAYLNRVFSYVDQNIQIKDSYMYVVSLG